VKPEEPIDFTALTLEHATNVMELALSGDLRESPSKHMITDAATIQQLNRIANSIENIEKMIGKYLWENTDVDLTKP
jgi:hypothetical protein